MSPYSRTSVTQDEHEWYQALARMIASRAADGLARGEMRLGAAHKYLIAAHLSALMDGAGEELALAFLDQLVDDLAMTPSEAAQAERDEIAFRAALADNLGRPLARAPRG